MKKLLLVGVIAAVVYYIYRKKVQAKSVVPELPADIGEFSIENTGIVYRNEGIIPQPVTSLAGLASTSTVELLRKQLQAAYNTVSKAGPTATGAFIGKIKSLGFTVVNGKVV
jgi:hypothetical protein